MVNVDIDGIGSADGVMVFSETGLSCESTLMD